MAYASWSPLWSGIVDSSIWCEPDHVRIIFVTMLALKDADHIYRGTAFQLSRRANKTEAEVLDALKILSAPDTRRAENQEFEGRRIEAVEEGWLILNGEKYRQLVSIEMKRARNRRAQAAFRERQKAAGKYPVPNPGLPGEARAARAAANGDEDAFNQAVNDHLPEAHPTSMPEYE